MSTESKFNVGDRVEIRKDSKYYLCGDNNPRGSGVVYGFGGLGVRVKWAAGVTNTYYDTDLKLFETTEEYTGGSSSYYDIEIGGTTVKCLDIIEALGMTYNEGNIFKAVWRIAAAKKGKKKKGNNFYYDSEKIVFFGERLMEEHKGGA